MKTIKTVMLLLAIFLFNSTIVLGQFSEEDIAYYKSRVNRNANILTKILSSIARNRDDSEKTKANNAVAMRKLKELFESDRSEIFHIFDPEKTQTYGYPYLDYVDRILDNSISDISIQWSCKGAVMWSGKYAIDEDNIRLKRVYDQSLARNKIKDWGINVSDLTMLVIKGKNDFDVTHYPGAFDKVILFDLIEQADGNWFLKINNIKSSNNKIALNKKKDTDGDGVPDIEDRCFEEPGSKDCKGCPFIDEDNDKVCDFLDRCPKVTGSPDNNGCPIIGNEDNKESTAKLRKYKKVIFPPVPSLVDYRLVKYDGYSKGKPHWIWATGVGLSYGTSAYFFGTCSLDYGGCKVPKKFVDGDFNKYRKAKLYRQNGFIFGAIGTLIWITDIVQAKRRFKRSKQQMNSATGLQYYHLGKSVELKPILTFSENTMGGIGLQLQF